MLEFGLRAHKTLYEKGIKCICECVAVVVVFAFSVIYVLNIVKHV